MVSIRWQGTPATPSPSNPQAKGRPLVASCHLVTRLRDWHKPGWPAGVPGPWLPTPVVPGARASERHFFLTGFTAAVVAAAAKIAAPFGIPLAAQQLKSIYPDHGLGALLAAAAVGPAVELEGADDA